MSAGRGGEVSLSSSPIGAALPSVFAQFPLGKNQGIISYIHIFSITSSVLAKKPKGARCETSFRRFIQDY